MKKDQNNCTKIEGLLLLRQEKSLTAEEEKFIDSHLQNCSACREFEKSVNQIKETVTRGKAEIQPNPQTLKFLKTYLKEEHDTPAGFWINFSNNIINFLRKPVPLYQAAVPVICAVLVSIFLNIEQDISADNYIKPQIDAVIQPGTSKHHLESCLKQLALYDQISG